MDWGIWTRFDLHDINIDIPRIDIYVTNLVNNIYFVIVSCRTVFHEYSEAMNTLSLNIIEFLGMSLGIERRYMREFYRDNDSILRLNYYPPCKQPNHTLGTGPHTDPTSLTILYQDHVGGLQVFVENQWRSIAPKPQSFVVNIGDTFMVIKLTFFF